MRRAAPTRFLCRKVLRRAYGAARAAAGQAEPRSPIRPALQTSLGSGKAQVAQLVEHVTENHGVGGSIPPLGTT
jgi:hypothetical protein